METFLRPFGFHAPNIRFKSTSCYVIPRKEKLIVLDMGVGVKYKLINYIISNNILPENIAIVISHNHIDHVAGVSAIGDFMLEFYPYSKIKLYMSDTSEKYYDWYSNILKKYGSVFDILVIDENFKFEFANFDISFCRTNHCEDKLKSFAIKLSDGYKSFVYTSDIASVDDNLKKFIKNSDLAMIDAGNPIRRIKTLKGYHGNTRENVCKVLDSGVNKIYLTHLKSCFEISDYTETLFEDTKKFVNVIEKEIYFDMFTGEEQPNFIRAIPALLA